MTLQQTITIPADRRVFFEFLAPQEIPIGTAEVEFTIMPSRSGALPPKPKDAPPGCDFWQDRLLPGEDPFALLDAHGPFEGPSVDEFLAERHAENEREEAKMAAMFGRKWERPE